MKQDSHSLPVKALLAFFGSFVALSLFDFYLRPIENVSLNSGFLFGLLSGNVLAVVISLALLVPLFFIAKKVTAMDYILLGLCGGSVVMNLAERIRFGGVIDYIPLFAGIRFNIADVIIVATVALIFWNKVRQ